MEVVGMPCVESYQDLDDSLPGVGALSQEQIAADVECETIIKDANRVRVEGDQFSIQCFIGRNRRAVVDEQVLCKSGHYESDIHPCELLRRHTNASFQ